MKLALIALILTLFAYPAFAQETATIHGIVYSWETLEPLNGAIVTINTEPEQKMISGPDYSFNVPFGSYIIKAVYENQIVEENIEISKIGSYNIDLILFPEIGEDVLEDMPDISDDLELEDVNIWLQILYAIVGVVIIFVVGLFLIYKKGKKTEIVKEVQVVGIDDELKNAIEIIRQNGGRILQKELRNRLKLSDAKVSLMVDDLESRGLVKKIKKGRGNIIRLNEHVK